MTDFPGFPPDPFKKLLEQLKRYDSLRHMQDILGMNKLQHVRDTLGLDQLDQARKALGLDLKEQMRKANPRMDIEDQARRTLEKFQPQLQQAALYQKLQRELSGRDAFIDQVNKMQETATGPMLAALKLQQQWKSAAGLSDQLDKFLEPASFGALTPILATLRSIDVFQEAAAAGAEEKEKAKKAVDTASRAAVAEPTLQDAVKQIVEAIEKAKTPTLKALLFIGLWQVLLMLASVMLQPIADEYIKVDANETQKASKRNITKRALDSVGDPGLLEGYRFVAVESLNVREDPSRDSQLVGKLKLGQLVSVLKKEGNWVLVFWSAGDDAAAIQGWVSARYLRTFRQPTPAKK